MINTNKLIKIENTIINLAAIEKVCINYIEHYSGEDWYDSYKEVKGIRIYYLNQPEGMCPYDIFASITLDEFWGLLNENTARS